MRQNYFSMAGICVMAIAMLLGCETGPTGGDTSNTIMLQSTQSECLGGLSLPPGKIAKNTPLVWFYAGHDTVIVDHDSTYYNCGSHLAVFLEQDDLELNFCEIDTLLTPMHCMCYFNVQAVVSGLSTGVYTVRLWQDDTGELLGETELFVPGR